jgi:hypothetical protein
VAELWSRVAAHLGPQHPSGAGEWGTLVGGVLVAAVAGGVLAVRVIGPGLRDAGERTDGSFWQARRTAVVLVLAAVFAEMLVTGRIHVELLADRTG